MSRKNASLVSPARRFFDWTTNLLVTGVVIVLGITVGRSVVYWWAPASSRSSPRGQAEQFLGAGSIAGDEDTHDLRFGDAPLLFRRQLFHGSFAELLEALRTQTIDLVSWSVPPQDELGPGESRILSGLAGRNPVTASRGIWEAFEEPVPLPMVVVVSAGGSADGPTEGPPSGSAGGSAGGSAEGPSGDVGSRARRVLSWGMAFPRGDSAGNDWTIFACCPSEGSGLGTGVLDEFPLPRGGRRVMSLGNAAGAALVSFHGVGPIGEWTRFYSEWCSRHGWTVDAPWRELNCGSYARFVDPRGTRVEVEIVIDRDQLRGLLSVVPPAVTPAPPLETGSKQEQEDS